MALIHEKIRNQRQDYLHKKSRQISDSCDAVCVEDLDMRGMSGALHFGKSVHDNGWGMFCTFLEYKLEEQGKRLVKVDRWYPSSKQCHVCGYRNSSLRLSDRRWRCPECGTEHERDHNASINIKEEGIRLLSAWKKGTVGHTGIARLLQPLGCLPEKPPFQDLFESKRRERVTNTILSHIQIVRKLYTR